MTDSEKRTRRFNVRFTESYFEDLKMFVEENTNFKLSEFIRQAIDEKRERIENPMQNGMVMSKEVMQKINGLETKIKELNKTVISRNSILEPIKKKLASINGNLYTKEIEIVSTFFDDYPKTHAYAKKEITTEDIIKETELKQNVVMWILQHSGLFEPKGRGWSKK